jgi:hypothetical protein
VKNVAAFHTLAANQAEQVRADAVLGSGVDEIAAHPLHQTTVVTTDVYGQRVIIEIAGVLFAIVRSD